MTTEKRNRSNYTEDFKRDAVALVTEQGYKISEAAGGGTTVEIDLKAEATMYHSLSASYYFDNGLTARLGVANVLDELPPRLTNQGTGNEVEVLGQVAFYSQYDWLARRYFLNVSMNFD